VTVLAIVLLIALIPVAVANWISVGILTRALRFDGAAMRERRRVALVLAHVSTLYLIVGLNTSLGFPWFDVSTTAVLNRTLYLVIGSIPIGFLILVRRIRR
jgi:hypothetical protein